MYLVDGPNQKAYGECERRKEEANDAPADPVAPGVDGIDLGDKPRHGVRLRLLIRSHPLISESLRPHVPGNHPKSQNARRSGG
jgi:hypothetical protein